MVLTNSLFNFIRERTDNQGVALLGAFVVWERLMVTTKYVMGFFSPEKSRELEKKLKIEEHKRNEKLREERELSKTKRQSSISTRLVRHSSEEKSVGTLTITKLDHFSSSSERSFLIDKESDNKIISRNSGTDNPKKAPQEKPSRKKVPAKTPKRRPKRVKIPAKTTNPPNNSPFKEFIFDDNDRSPLLTKDIEKENSPAISDILSMNYEYDTESDGGYRTPLKPSMQHSMISRHHESQLHAADERIRHRISACKSEKKNTRNDFF